MNIALWVLQILLALHTAMGAVWKLSNSAQTVPSLEAIPRSVWLALCAVELVCAVALVLPALSKPLGVAAPIAALCIAMEMLAFCAVHLQSGATVHGQLGYWLVVAALCGLLAWGRLVLKPF